MTSDRSFHQAFCDLARKSDVTIITAVQVANPYRVPRDIGASWEPLIITIDYMNMLSRSHE